MKTSIKIEKFEKINDGIMYVYYVATNMETGEKRRQKNSYEYYGDDIINLSSLSEKELNNIPIINGRRYGDEILVSSEIRQYNEENIDNEINAEAWAEEIHNAIVYVI